MIPGPYSLYTLKKPGFLLFANLWCLSHGLWVRELKKISAIPKVLFSTLLFRDVTMLVLKRCNNVIEVKQTKINHILLLLFKVAQLRKPSVTTRRPKIFQRKPAKSRRDSLRRKGSPAFFLPQLGIKHTSSWIGISRPEYIQCQIISV